MPEYQEKEIKRENVIFEYINKFCKNRLDFAAVYINLHSLAEDLRSQQNKKAIADTFMPLVKNAEAKVFMLPNEDVVVIFVKKAKAKKELDFND